LERGEGVARGMRRVMAVSVVEKSILEDGGVVQICRNV